MDLPDTVRRIAAPFVRVRVAVRRAPIPVQVALRQTLPLALGALCLWALTRRMPGLDLAALGAAWQQIAPQGWIMAMVFTAISFWAVGRYDAVVHRHLQTGLPSHLAARAGMMSIALAQTLGLGVITGALARWRALPHSSLATCTRISLLVAVSFLAGWAVVTSLVCLLAPDPPGARLLWGLVLMMALALAALALTRAQVPLWRGQAIRLPSLPAMGAIVWFTFIDTLAAALALHALMPETLALGFASLYPAFLLALGAALLSGTPGGVGPFELVLLALLPGHDGSALLAGILGFRLIYYAMPAALSAVLLSLPQRPAARPAPPLRPRPGLRTLAHARRSELGVALQNGGWLLCAPHASAVVIETGQTLTALFDPAEGTVQNLAATLVRRARSTNRIPVLYKCNAHSALAARRAGFALWHIADEAVIDPTRFDLSERSRRQLRRKLRQADKTGLRISRAATLPLADMAEIDADWSARQGGARGLTMGRFDGAYLSHHQVYLAHLGETLVGFVTFHASAHELCLDLMRQSAEAPPGTMHALVAHAIDVAASHGRRRLSLASVPALGRRPGRLESRLRRAIFAAAGGPGLMQFKSSFAPRFQPLYLAAPSTAGLVIAATDLALRVRSPAHAQTDAPHNNGENFPIAAPALL